MTRLRSDDDIQPGTMLVFRERGMLTAIPCTVTAVHREDDGAVPQIIVRRASGVVLGDVESETPPRSSPWRGLYGVQGY